MVRLVIERSPVRIRLCAFVCCFFSFRICCCCFFVVFFAFFFLFSGWLDMCSITFVAVLWQRFIKQWHNFFCSSNIVPYHNSIKWWLFYPSLCYFGRHPFYRQLEACLYFSSVFSKLWFGPVIFLHIDNCSVCLENGINLMYKCYFYHIFYHLGPDKRICVFDVSIMTSFNCACPAIQRGQGSGFLSEGSSWLTACMSEQRRFWRDCADAQARLNLRCSHRW